MKIKGTYELAVTGYDWGCGTDAVITLDSAVTCIKDIRVTEYKQTTDFTKIPEFPVIVTEFARTVEEAYPCDENGNKAEGPSARFFVKMTASPSEGSPLLFSMKTMFNTWSDPYELRFSGTAVTGKEEAELDIDPVCRGMKTDADRFSFDTFRSSSGMAYDYAYYIPEGGSDKLLIWLHGIGEGGTDHTDPKVTVLANKVTAYIGDELQEAVGKACVLVPQCPTYWMDGDGTGTNLANGSIQADGTSFYTESLMELIRDFKTRAGTKKTVLSGCSNGGYMTLVMTINYPQEFDAIIPVCEAVADKFISDEQIAVLKEMPSYYVYSRDDTTVDPLLHEEPTLRRIIKAGAKELYVSNTDHVEDLSGKVLDKDGRPYRYPGHWSWIYLFNNECDAVGYKAFDFIKDHLN
ncbi:MAG: hypothetical protein K6G61_04480 [Solobacterium sp.]|nr:hypothetical protein [Solobacterium sp.]